MKRKTKMRTIMIATALTSLLSATAVFADTTSSNTVQVPIFSQTHSGEDHGSFKSCLDRLVKAGSITQTQEVAIQSALPTAKEAGAAKGELKAVLDALVNAGTITRVQEDAIQSLITPAKEADKANGDVKK